ncbi:hypothetical protein ES319_A07G121100v1 [Gossypium barbadense]|uniref:Uncharacterized protein n=3 Tax=Gossypium TaxID=3633 RepID=A0A5J5V2T6_GOSBA|nr:hypothetical protein ES319_A07G121100v1 [Gossypium barbadense]TYH09838.1 hypothetical protein ES288_A07G129500v1 [Gossypium darwinii]TYI18943.1 hypothetical protein ES332_A07G129000v1 [Gossypium tomentosum]
MMARRGTVLHPGFKPHIESQTLASRVRSQPSVSTKKKPSPMARLKVRGVCWH